MKNISIKTVFSIAIIILFVFVSTSCQKENDPKKVTYTVTGFGDPFKVVYAIGDGSKTKMETITPNGISDSWTYSFSEIPGGITYLYIESKEDISASMSFNAAILINGTTFQKASYYDKKRITPSDTVYVIKRSGTIPF